MDKYTISVLVENNAGVLSRIAGLFSRRGYNIESLSVGVTEDSKISRMTICGFADEQTLEQIKKQLNKLIEVIKVVQLASENSVYRELAMIKVKADDASRASIAAMANIFRANIIDVSPESLTLEVTGDEGKIDAFINLMKPYGIIELLRTGTAAIQRGENGI
ncbi:acetolactate synthase small subunit (plasmid) [Peptoclostridium acidaminophilum DSM 3953]|uniref:Acetolactate synthase small subunit n=1 Tax=Peptoclostridium acidaminophilum DSM 3953 TaxID=1286171 RepID=W8TIA1_PEPAC|nr:acetolactate synthase small subunit [Peptoclostridium acidaminophilum]AHM57568.1 acetolactate synthase small subunit [Peptoclostridium acidaminophilum DSM 3953]